MKDFPLFMKRSENHICSGQQNTQDVDGYYYEGHDGGQMAFWTCYSSISSSMHVHDFDEYMVCIAGQYTAILNGDEIILNPGDELFIPKGTMQCGRVVAGTRTIHAFGGKRIK